MVLDEKTRIEKLVERIRELSEGQSPIRFKTVIGLSQMVLCDTVGTSHPLMKVLDQSDDEAAGFFASKTVVELFDEGVLISPRLAIAHEIEGDILDIAQKQVEASEGNTDATHKQLQLGIAAFLAGAALEDALRRLCDASGISYPQRTSISILQTALYQPSKQIEVISGSENKQIIAWGETRNNADHGWFDKITCSEVLSMVIGVRGFIDKHLP